MNIKKLFHNQRGSSHIVLVMGLVVVAAVGFIGYKIIQQSSASTAKFGNQSVGTGVEKLAATKIGSVATPTQSGSVTALSFYLDGHDPSASGSASVVAAVYSDASGAPSKLLGTSAASTVAANAAAKWVNFTFATPVGVTANTKYWLVVSGGNQKVVRAYYTKTSGTQAYNVNSGTTKASNPFGTVSTRTGTISGYATYTVGTVTPPPAPGPTPPPPPPSSGGEKFGMSAPASLWSQRLADVGGPAHIKFRRIYLTGFDAGLSLVKQAEADGMTPVISWKTGSYSWSQVANGSADGQLKTLVTNLNAISGPKILAIHHEPNGDGTPADWSAMQLHALPILKTATNVKVGVIGNGWWWSKLSQGLSDAEIAQWIPDSVINISDFVAADTYQDANLNEDGGVKMQSMADWADRHPNVKALGVGEFNGLTAAAITNSMNVAKRESKFQWALVWNSSAGSLGTPLSGDRLTAFKAGLATTNPL